MAVGENEGGWRYLRCADAEDDVGVACPEDVEVHLDGVLALHLVHLDSLYASRDAAEGEALEAEGGEE